MPDLKTAVAFVTGASSGIGRATARLLAEEGAKVACAARTVEKLEALVREIEGAGGTAVAVECDVADSGSVERAIDETIRALGVPNVVVANAGINGTWAPIDELTPDEFEKTIRTNLTGTYLTLHHAVPHMKKKGGGGGGGGAIVIVSSINGTRTFTTAGSSAYSASKAAQVALMKVNALELAKHGIRVNAVCPGAIETEIDEKTEKRRTEEAAEPREYPEGQIPLTRGRPGDSFQVARLIRFLVSEESDLISGTEVWIDGAQSLLV